MNPITLDNVVNYLSESIDDPALVSRIERERETNPRVAAWFEELKSAALLLAEPNPEDGDDEIIRLDYVRQMITETEPSVTDFWESFAAELSAARMQLAEGKPVVIRPIPDEELTRIGGFAFDGGRSSSALAGLARLSASSSSAESSLKMECTISPREIVCRELVRVIEGQELPGTQTVLLIVQDNSGSLLGSREVVMHRRPSINYPPGFWYCSVPFTDVVAAPTAGVENMCVYCVPQAPETESLFASLASDRQHVVGGLGRRAASRRPHPAE